MSHSEGLYKGGLTLFRLRLLFTFRRQRKHEMIKNELIYFARRLKALVESATSETEKELYRAYFVAVAGGVRHIEQDWDKTYHFTHGFQTVKMRASVKQFTSEVAILQKQFSEIDYQSHLLRRAREIRQVFGITLKHDVSKKLMQTYVELNEFLTEISARGSGGQ